MLPHHSRPNNSLECRREVVISGKKVVFLDNNNIHLIFPCFQQNDVLKNTASSNDKKTKGRTGWPQHVWALELKQ